MRIILNFKTEKGRETFNKIEEIGRKQKSVDKAITNRIFKQTILQSNPELIVQIKPKITWLAKKVNIVDQMINGLNNEGLKIGVDYNLEVKND